MRIPFATPLFILLFVLTSTTRTTLASASPPQVVCLVPAIDDRRVDADVDTLELHFDVPMGAGITLNSMDLPEITGPPAWDREGRVLRIPVRLQAAHWYRLKLNSADDLGFASATGEPLAPLTWTFRTAGGSELTDLDHPGLAAQLAAVPLERALAGGRLRMTHLYAVQARIMLECHGLSDSVLAERMVERVYRPYASFWDAYLRDEQHFRDFVRSDLAFQGHPIHSRLRSVLALHLDSLFTASEAWLARKTGTHPRGEWVLVFGPGYTDMGGLGSQFMLIDFTRQSPDPRAVQALLPHELTHQVHGRRGADPDGETVLGRIISEGLACYAASAYAAANRELPVQVAFDSVEWQAGLAHEHELTEALRPMLRSRDRTDLDRVASHSERLLPDGPVAAGYFVGFRIMQAFVARHGAGSWVRATRMPVRQVLIKSGHPLGRAKPIG